jgi:hypothetical protein
VISSSTALLGMKFRIPICENNWYLEEFKLNFIFLSSQSLHINTSPSRIHFINWRIFPSCVEVDVLMVLDNSMLRNGSLFWKICLPVIDIWFGASALRGQKKRGPRVSAREKNWKGLWHFSMEGQVAEVCKLFFFLIFVFNILQCWIDVNLVFSDLWWSWVSDLNFVSIKQQFLMCRWWSLIPSFGWRIKFYRGLAILDDFVACKSCNQIITRFCASSMDKPIELFL